MEENPGKTAAQQIESFNRLCYAEPMFGPPPSRDEWITQQARRFNKTLSTKPLVWNDTTNYMYIERDHVIDLQGTYFLVRCNEHEGRFGIDEQPKFWVKRALNLQTGEMHVLKLTCQEQFRVNVGDLQIRCTRSAEKEAQVLELTRGDRRFMQGYAIRDNRGNLVRVVDFIPGTDLLSYIDSIPVCHEEYSNTLLPGILARIASSFEAVKRLHDAGLCHGDIRNDHLLVERDTDDYRWIDFDLKQDLPDFDVWSTGNILHCIAGKGFVTFREVLDTRPELSGRLVQEDASVFFPQRVMNLRKVYPYMPARLNDILLRFSFGARACYDKVSQVADELAACVASMG